MNFKDFHDQTDPILICNVWDVNSAKIAEQLNFQAIGTSSGAIATMLGYPDGEKISFDELLYIVTRIRKKTTIALTVDLESGYSRDAFEIVEHIKKLEQLGVIGINIEDSIVRAKRVIMTRLDFAKLLDKICTRLIQSNIKTFINVRTDTFLLGLPNAVSETLVRANTYQESGAHGIFVPCIEKEEDIETVVKNIDIPLNVMCMPKLPKFEILKSLGVKRISMGNFIFNKISVNLKKKLVTIQNDKSFKNLFENL